MKTKEFEKKFLPYLEQVSRVILLDVFYPITLKYKKVLDEDDHKVIAMFNDNYPYKDIEIEYSDKLMKQKDKVVKEVLLHEMCHAVTSPLAHKGAGRYITEGEISDVEEETVEHIANIIRKNNIL